MFEDARRGVYQKLLFSHEGERLVGGILVGDASRFGALRALCRAGEPVTERPEALLFGVGSAAGAAAEPSDDAQICACNDVSRGAIRCAIAERELTTVGGIKACTRAGTGCGGCVPQLTQILTRELERAGRTIDRNLCEHFAYTRQQLFEIVKIGRIKSFDALLASHGKGNGCEVCRPAVASILASRWNDPILDHATIQDTNDRYLANIQRGGTYSVIPRIPGGEITPAKLCVLGEIARKYDLYVKITGGQRIDLLGARVEQLPEIWEELVAAGFESGHAYGKAMRTVKSCIGSTWCRYGVQDSVAFAIRVEERYRGIRAPHKLKCAVSGCIRECAEAQSKDFGIIATEKGWNLYLAGNGGTNPRHADLVASDVDEATVLRLIDRFLMYYIHTANPLERTARWVERQDGGIDYVKSVIIDDALGICADLDRDMQALVDSYECEWKAVVESPERRRAFSHFANSDASDPALRFEREREPEAARRLAGRRRRRAVPEPDPRARAALGAARARRRFPARRRPHREVRRGAARGIPLREPRRVVCDAGAVPAPQGHGARARPARQPGRRAEGRLPAAQEDVLARDGEGPLGSAVCDPHVPGRSARRATCSRCCHPKTRSPHRRSPRCDRFVTLLAVCLIPAGASADAADDVANGIAVPIVGGTVKLDVRARCEHADADDFPPSNAATVRTRLGYGTPALGGALRRTPSWRTSRSPIATPTSTASRRTRAIRTVIADPPDTEVNQAYLLLDRPDWLGTSREGRPPADRARRPPLHRQRRLAPERADLRRRLGAERFLASSGSSVGYGYIADVRRIFGNQGPRATRDFDSNSHLARVAVDVAPWFQPVAFAYLLDLRDAPAESSNSYGVRVDRHGSVRGAVEPRLPGQLRLPDRRRHERRRPTRSTTTRTTRWAISRSASRRSARSAPATSCSAATTGARASPRRSRRCTSSTAGPTCS